MNQACTPASNYLNLFHDPGTATLARCLAYISGAFLAALLLISFLGEGVLLYVHAGKMH